MRLALGRKKADATAYSASVTQLPRCGRAVDYILCRTIFLNYGFAGSFATTVLTLLIATAQVEVGRPRA